MLLIHVYEQNPYGEKNRIDYREPMNHIFEQGKKKTEKTILLAFI